MWCGRVPLVPQSQHRGQLQHILAQQQAAVDGTDGCTQHHLPQSAPPSRCPTHFLVAGRSSFRQSHMKTASADLRWAWTLGEAVGTHSTTKHTCTPHTITPAHHTLSHLHTTHYHTCTPHTITPAHHTLSHLHTTHYHTCTPHTITLHTTH